MELFVFLLFGYILFQLLKAEAQIAAVPVQNKIPAVNKEKNQPIKKANSFQKKELAKTYKTNNLKVLRLENKSLKTENESLKRQLKNKTVLLEIHKNYIDKVNKKLALAKEVLEEKVRPLQPFGDYYLLYYGVSVYQLLEGKIFDEQGQLVGEYDPKTKKGKLKHEKKQVTFTLKTEWVAWFE